MTTSQRHSTSCAYLIYHTRSCNCHLAKPQAADAVVAKGITQPNSTAFDRLR